MAGLMLKRPHHSSIQWKRIWRRSVIEEIEISQTYVLQNPPSTANQACVPPSGCSSSTQLPGSWSNRRWTVESKLFGKGELSVEEHVKDDSLCLCCTIVCACSFDGMAADEDATCSRAGNTPIYSNSRRYQRRYTLHPTEYESNLRSAPDPHFPSLSKTSTLAAILGIWHGLQAFETHQAELGPLDPNLILLPRMPHALEDESERIVSDGNVDSHHNQPSSPEESPARQKIDIDGRHSLRLFIFSCGMSENILRMRRCTKPKVPNRSWRELGMETVWPGT